MWSTKAILALMVLTLSFASVACSDPGDGVSAIHEDGVELMSEERWEEAVSAFTEVIEFEPSTDLLVNAHLNRSRALVELGRTDAAIADETAVISLASVEPSLTSQLALAHLNRSRELASLGRWDDALVDAEAAVELNPENPLDLAKALVNRATSLLWLDRNEEALVAAAEVITLNPDHDDLLRQAHEVRLYALWKADGSPDDVIAEATAVIDLAPDDVQSLAGAHFFRGVSLGLLGQMAAARPDLEAVTGLLPADHQWRQDAQELLATMTQ